jgi:sialate O-acetylesterase
MRAKFVFVMLLLVGALAFAEVNVSPLFSDHMVLQRDKPIMVFGTAGSSETVKIEIGTDYAVATTDNEGKWFVALPARSSGDNLTLKISTSDKTITIKDIVMGDVWLCGGQSNMELKLDRSMHVEEFAPKADYPMIRLLQVKRIASEKTLPYTSEPWRVCKPNTAKSFSAVGFHFGQSIHAKTKVPIGLVSVNWGGTRIEPWTPTEGFASVPETKHVLENMQRQRDDYLKNLPKQIDEMEKWIPAARQALKTGGEMPSAPKVSEHPHRTSNKPIALYNGMVAGIVPFSIKGAIWYQGEANRGMNDYFYYMKALINGWRQVFRSGEFPFYYVQIAPWQHYPGESLPRLWEQQTKALTIKNTGMVVTTDLVDDISDIHPRNKRDVGQRLALWALAKDYGVEGVVYSGPLYKSFSVEGAKIRVSFDHAGGLKSRDGKELNWFEIAGEDKKFVKATAIVDGGTVVVSSDAVAKPVAVRFAFDKLAMPNFVNSAGLPAGPFRTDSW